MDLKGFIKRPVLSTVISVLIVILGLIGLFSLPVSQYPDIAPPTIQVSATYTGANAQTILKSVIVPLEEQINGVENMTYMTSTATNDGTGSITIYFKQGTNPDMAAVNVQNLVSKANSQLPKEVVQVGVTTKKRQTSQLMINTIYSSDGRLDETFIQNYVKINILPKVLRVNGVGDATIFGSRDYSMRIWLKPDVMSQFGITPNDVNNAITDQNIEAAPGKFGENGDQSFQYIMRYKGRLTNETEFEDIIVKAFPDGRILRIKDVARVELGALTYSIRTRAQGMPGVTFSVYQTAGSNATEVINNINEVIQEASKSFPHGMKTANILDANEFLYASIHKIVETLIEAFILVFIVIFIFLQDFRSTLIPAISIPVALIGTFFFLHLFGFSINLLTLFALLLAIAIVVDDAIVVVEAVHAKLDAGYTSARKAARHAMREISGAIVSITLVMAAVFIPVSFIGGTSGIFYTQFGITLAIAIVLSAINALTLSPTLCAIFLKPKNENDSKKNLLHKFHQSFNIGFGIVKVKYQYAVLFFLKKRKWVWVLIVGVIILLGVLLKVTPTDLIPNEDLGVFYVNITLPPSSSLERTIDALEEVDSIIASCPLVETRSSVAGNSQLSGAGSTYGMVICKLIPWDKRKKKGEDVNSVIKQLMEQTAHIPDTKVNIFAPPTVRGFGKTSGFEFNLQDRKGGDLETFYQVAEQFLEKLNQRPEIQRATTTFNPGFPEYTVDVNMEKVAMAGLTLNQVMSTLQGYYGGIYSSNLNLYGKMYRVMMQADSAYRAKEQDLDKIYVKAGEQMTPITEFVNLRRTYGPETVTRFNMFTSIAVTGTPNDGYSSGEALRAIDEVASQTLPVGYGYEFSGLSREESQSSNTIIYVFALCLIFVYFLLAAQYESYLLPFAILISIPLGLTGSFLFALMMGCSNNIYLQIALIMLVGLLAKNAILIIQFALERRKAGMTVAQAAISGATARLRPILMTSFAMIIGLIPLMFASGVGANGNRSIGAGAVGGMLVGTFIGVLIVPALFIVFQTLQERMSGNDDDDDDDDD